jgi:hypothetical protein
MSGRWFSLGTLASSTPKKTDRLDIQTEILLKVTLNMITLNQNGEIKCQGQ